VVPEGGFAEPAPSSGGGASRNDRLDALEAEVEALKGEVARLRELLEQVL